MKVFIFGISGSGKSRLAKKLAADFKVKHIELDEFYFLPGWVVRSVEDFVADVEDAIKEQDWVICGSSRHVRLLIMQQADVIVWLNYPFLKTFWQTLKRTFKRLITKEPCCNGNYETIRRQFFSRHSIFWFVITKYRRRKQVYYLLSQDPTFKKKWVTVHNKHELERFLENAELGKVL